METETNIDRKFPVAAVFTAEVEDFPSWKRTFDSGAELRRGAGITFTHINHDAENPKLLTIYLGGPDANRVRAFVSSPELQTRMRASGVKGAPEGELFRPVENMTKGQALAAAIVRHRVADFDAWKAGFDAFAAGRAAAGIVGHGISRKVDDPSVVVVYLQSNSLESLRTYLSSPELTAKMKANGVETPVVKFVHGEEPQH